MNRGPQDADRLVGGERAALAEDVDVFGELIVRCVPLLFARGDHFLADDVDIFVGMFAKFRWDDVRAQQCSDDGSRPMLGSTFDGFERFNFVFQT